MPHAPMAVWFVVYTLPVDDYKYKHTVKLRSIDDERHIRGQWRNDWNKDMKIVELTRLNGDEDDVAAFTVKKIAETRAEGGPDFYDLKPGEEHLTKKQVEKARAEIEAMRTD